jgi:D-aspartate ligase
VSHTPPPIPAVVVGGSLNALGVVRSLARGRMPIYLLETTRRCAAAWSRHCNYVPISAPDGRALTTALVELARKLACRPVLILTSDQSVNCVSENRRVLEPLYRISLPAAQMVETLADKTLFQGLAEREGFNVPRSVCISDPAGLDRLAALTPPLIVKPGDKTLVLKGLAERAVVAATLIEARRAAARMLSCAPRVIVQHWIDGPDTEIFFALFSCDSSGKLLGLFPGRKLVCSPPAIGNTAVCVAAPAEAGELASATLQFIKQVGYRGLGSLEFKRDRRSGRFVIIEPTVGRTDWQEEIATLCGINLPLLTYYSELGAQLTSPEVVFPKVAWRSSVGIRSSLGPDVRTVDGYLRWSDPLPALYYYGYERVLLRLWSKAAGKAPPLRRDRLAKE